MTSTIIRQTIQRGNVRPETAVMWVLAETGGELTLANVQNLYTNGNNDTKWLILKAESIMQVPGMETQLRNIVQNETNLDLRIAALEALAALKDINTLAILTPYLTSSNDEVRAAAQYAYEVITGTAYRG